MSTRDGPGKHLLLLAGSGESGPIAGALAQRGELALSVSLLHPPREPVPAGVHLRTGGFGGAEGFEAFLETHAITAVLDATHPFAVRIGTRSAEICARRGLPFARVLRPGWRPGPGDDWRHAADEAAAQALLDPGQRVFTTTGRATLERLAAGSGAAFLVRQKGAGAPAPEMNNVSYVYGKGPFSTEEEIETLRGLEIDVLVVKNSGGTISRTKLYAARALGLPVIVIARPPQPAARRLRSVGEALDWVAAL